MSRHQLAEGELFWRYAFICCEPGRDQSAGLAVERHRLKGDKERQFSQVLRDLDWHHPPCQSLAANQVFYALGALGHNLLQAIKLIHLPDNEQPVRIRTLLHLLMLIPVQFKRHARKLKAVCCVSSQWLPWWRAVASTGCGLHLGNGAAPSRPRDSPTSLRQNACVTRASSYRIANKAGAKPQKRPQRAS